MTRQAFLVASALLLSCTSSPSTPYAYETYFRADLEAATAAKRFMQAQADEFQRMFRECPASLMTLECSERRKAQTAKMIEANVESWGAFLRIYAGVSELESNCGRKDTAGTLDASIASIAAGASAELQALDAQAEETRARQRIREDLEKGNISLDCSAVEQLHGAVASKATITARKFESVVTPSGR